MDKQSATTVAKRDISHTITHRLRMADFEITLDDADRVMVNNNLLHLPPAANQTFCELIRANGRLCSLSDLVLARQNGHGDPENTGSLKVHVSVIRTVLAGRDGVLRKLITTIYGVGYYIDRRHYIEPAVPPEEPALTVGNASIYFPQHGGCLVNGDPLPLGPIRTRLFKMLVEHGEAVCTWTDFATATYGSDKTLWPEHKLYDVLVCTMRPKLKKALGRNIIGTVWGRGYHILLDVHASTDYSSTSKLPNGYVIGPSGQVLTCHNLPDPKGRWVPSRKAVIVALLQGAVVTRDFVLQRYPNLSGEELDVWVTNYTNYGLRGLKQKALVSA